MMEKNTNDTEIAVLNINIKNLSKVVDKLEGAMSNLDKRMDSILKLETRVAILEVNYLELAEKVKELERQRNWIVGLVVGAVLLALLALVLGNV